MRRWWHAQQRCLLRKKVSKKGEQGGQAAPSGSRTLRGACGWCWWETGINDEVYVWARPKFQECAHVTRNRPSSCLTSMVSDRAELRVLARGHRAGLVKRDRHAVRPRAHFIGGGGGGGCGGSEPRTARPQAAGHLSARCTGRRLCMHICACALYVADGMQSSYATCRLAPPPPPPPSLENKKCCFLSCRPAATCVCCLQLIILTHTHTGPRCATPNRRKVSTATATAG